LADSESAEPGPPKRRLSPNLAAGTLLLVLAVALLLWQRPWASSPSDDVVPVPDDAAALLQDQVRELSEAESEPAFVAAAGSSRAAREFATEAWQARDALDVTDIELRYLGGGEVPDRADGSTVAEVAVSWRVGSDSPISGTSIRDASVDLRLDPQRDGTLAIRSAEARDAALPLWLAGKIDVERRPNVRIVTIDGGVPDLDEVKMAAIAHEGVRRVMPRTKGDLTVVSPRTRGLAAGLVGRKPSEIAPIAAISTTVDGGSATARVIVLNPDQFATMDRRAGQVVLSHEATHLLTGAIGRQPEPWVAEGFADFVALHDDTAPLSLSAGQALRRVKDDGPPETLPSANDFDKAGHGLGAVYEATWMVFRMLGERYDDRTIVRFYRDVLSGTGVDVAVSRAFDLTIDELTAQWRDYLTKSASTVS
jgi:hypothetical protein